MSRYSDDIISPNDIHSEAPLPYTVILFTTANFVGIANVLVRFHSHRAKAKFFSDFLSLLNVDSKLTFLRTHIWETFLSRSLSVSVDKP